MMALTTGPRLTKLNISALVSMILRWYQNLKWVEIRDNGRVRRALQFPRYLFKEDRHHIDRCVEAGLLHKVNLGCSFHLTLDGEKLIADALIARIAETQKALAGILDNPLSTARLQRLEAVLATLVRGKNP